MSVWATALAEYLGKRAYSDELPRGHDDEDRALDEYCDAMDRLIDVPAPDLVGLLFKIELVRYRSEDFTVTDEYWTAILIDIQALAGPRAACGRLISSPPDLLNACLSYAEAYDAATGMTHGDGVIRAAIAKAVGEIS